MEECNNGNFETLLSQTPRLTMSFPDGSARSDGSVHLKRQITYTMTLSEHITGKFDLIVVRKHYPYEPLLGCPFSIPTMPHVNFRKMSMSHDTLTHFSLVSPSLKKSLYTGDEFGCKDHKSKLGKVN